MTTTGVLLRKAEKSDTTGSSRALAFFTDVFFLGSMLKTICSNMPLRLTPSLTRKSKATVIIPLLEKPSRQSLGVSIPAHSISTTQVKSMSPGFSLSAISAHIMSTRQHAT